MRLSSQGKRCELVKGGLVELELNGCRHGRIASRLNRWLRIFVEQNDLGEVFAAEIGFRLSRSPDTVLAPDAAFVAKDRLPAEDGLVGFPELVPDLVVEVVSPSDTASQVQSKAEDLVRAGVRLVWVVYPDTRSVVAYRSLDDIGVRGPGDELQGGPVLPGFSCPVADLF